MLRKKNNIISHTLILLALMAFLTACTASQSVSEQKRAEKAEQVSTVVQNALNSRHFTLNVNNMYPVSASSKYVGGEFFLEIKGDTLRSYLPYFGAVYHSSYNMGNALDFEQKMESFQQVRKKKNCTTIYISVRTAEDSSNTHSTSSTMVVLICMYCRSIASLSPTMANSNSKYFPRKA